MNHELNRVKPEKSEVRLPGVEQNPAPEKKEMGQEVLVAAGPSHTSAILPITTKKLVIPFHWAGHSSSICPDVPLTRPFII